MEDKKTIDNCDVYASGSYQVEISHGHRIMKKLPLKAKVDCDTGEVTFYVDKSEIDKLI